MLKLLLIDRFFVKIVLILKRDELFLKNRIPFG